MILPGSSCAFERTCSWTELPGFGFGLALAVASAVADRWKEPPVERRGSQMSALSARQTWWGLTIGTAPRAAGGH